MTVPPTRLAMTLKSEVTPATGRLRITASLMLWDGRSTSLVVDSNPHGDLFRLQCDISYRKGELKPVTCSGFYFQGRDRIRPNDIDTMRKTFQRIDRGLTRISNTVPISDGVQHILAVASTLRVSVFLAPSRSNGWEDLDGTHAADSLMRTWIRQADMWEESK